VGQPAPRPGGLRPLTPRQRRRLRSAAGVLALAFVALAVIVAGGHAAAVDEGVRSFVAFVRHPGLDRPMRRISRWSSGSVLVPTTAIASLLLWRRHARLALFLLGLAFTTAAASTLTKWLVDRPRPNLVAYGFPSGHVFGAAVFFGMLIYLLWALDGPRRWRVLGGAASAIAVALVALSRLYVNAHWGTDVLGGLVGGTSLLLFAVTVLDGWIASSRAGGLGAAGRPSRRP
jgi:membrane-associated phospholipid phosphatase